MAPEMSPKRLLGLSWALLGLSCAILGLSWGCLGLSWGLSWAVLSTLEAALASLGAVLGRLGFSWGCLGLSWSCFGSESHLTNIPKNRNFEDPFAIPVWLRFRALWVSLGSLLGPPEALLGGLWTPKTLKNMFFSGFCKCSVLGL